MAEADGNRTRRGTLVPPLVLKTREPTRRSFASARKNTRGRRKAGLRVGLFPVAIPGFLREVGRVSVVETKLLNRDYGIRVRFMPGSPLRPPGEGRLRRNDAVYVAGAGDGSGNMTTQG